MVIYIYLFFAGADLYLYEVLFKSTQPISAMHRRASSGQGEPARLYTFRTLYLNRNEDEPSLWNFNEGWACMVWRDLYFLLPELWSYEPVSHWCRDIAFKFSHYYYYMMRHVEWKYERITLGVALNLCKQTKYWKEKVVVGWLPGGRDAVTVTG